ncbi:hypothetical protein BKA61DRAFT_579107 [Leptodontidium sp. MPI-SDFR-AT-0119]|nr:hypothetical protein BKA61DRAFT_579107 [Leptodontidium sp. MPI-SDFR-AT-0119]
MADKATPLATAPATTPATNSKRPSPAPKTRQRARLSNPTAFVALITGKGKDPKEFRVHKDFACHYPPVLKATFDNDFLEGKSQTYKFPEADEATMSFLVHWFYTQELIVDSLVENKWNNKEMRPHIKLWILADSLLLPRLQNTVVEKIIQVQDTFGKTAVNCLPYIYENTAVGNPLRQLMLHRCACIMRAEFYTDKPEYYPKEMLLELAVIACDARNHPVLMKQTGHKSDPSQYKVAEDLEA